MARSTRTPVGLWVLLVPQLVCLVVGVMSPRDPSPRLLLLTGLWLLVFALALLIVMVRSAEAGGFDPPTARKAQRLIGNAYDARLRSVYPRSGITTRCRGRRRIICSVHVMRRNELLYWQLTRVDFQNGVVTTSLSATLVGVIAVRGRPTSYRSKELTP